MTDSATSSYAPGASEDVAALAAAVTAAEQRFAESNPASAARARRAGAVMPGGNTRTVLHHAPFPLSFVGGQGARLTSADGREYVDLLGEYTAGLFGHSNPRIIAAITAALDSGITLGGHNQAEARLAELVAARFALDAVRFTNSGTEANLMALSAAIAYTGRRRILVCEGAYHGGVLSFGHGPSPVNVPHAWVTAPYNDVAAARRLIREHSSDLAAVIVEPMQGAGGCVPGDPVFLRALRDETAAVGALLIFDEVMTSRLAPGGLQAALGIHPDLTTVGKYLGGGMSFGAFGGRREVMDQFDPYRPDALEHAGTFNNNVLTMHAGVAALDGELTDEALGALNRRGDALRGRIMEIAERHSLDMVATGIGSLLTIHVGTRHHQDSHASLQHLLFLHMCERGYWIAARGMIALSLPVTDEDCDGAVEAVEAFAESYGHFLR